MNDNTLRLAEALCHEFTDDGHLNECAARLDAAGVYVLTPEVLAEALHADHTYAPFRSGGETERLCRMNDAEQAADILAALREMGGAS